MAPEMAPRVELVAASRQSREGFPQTALGRSLQRLAFDARLRPVAFVANRTGLPALYNQRIEATTCEALVFVHDDVWVEDVFLVDRVLEALQDHDVVGVAGNRRIAPRHVSWAYPDDDFAWDAPEHLSGAVAHGPTPGAAVQFFGAHGACELLDGVLLAARRDALLRSGVRFDPQFEFHFYDLDFCRSARAAGLRLATWPIAITHQSGGSFANEAWRAGLERYRRKWD